MSTYFPPSWALFGAIGSDLTDPETHRVSISVGLLKMIIQAALQGAGLDEDSYQNHNADLKQACRDGQISNLIGHWIETGYFEGRKGSSSVVDEGWYIEKYPDVGLAIEKGDVRNAAEHYHTSGEREWRVPNPDSELTLRNWRRAFLTQIATVDELKAVSPGK